MDEISDLKTAQRLVGPWLVGTLVDLYLLGVLTVQFVLYWTWYHDDRLSLRLAVVGLQILTFLKSTQCVALTWVQCIRHMNDLKGAVELSQTAWWQTYNSLFVALCSLYVQLYFCYRLWIISQRLWWPLAPVVALLFVSLGAACYASITIDDSWFALKIGDAFAIHLGAGFTADVILASMTGFFLLRSRNGAEIRNSVVSALFRMTFQTQVPAVLCALLNLIFSQSYEGEENLISVGFNQTLPKLYAISMMWTLNERRNIRTGNPNEIDNSKARNQGGLSAPILSTILQNSSHIEIFTRTETVKHIGGRRIRDEELNENLSVSYPLRTFELRPPSPSDYGSRTSRSPSTHTIRN